MLQLKPKQAKAVEAVNNPLIGTLVLLGAVGTGKTDIAAYILISICHTFPKTLWPVCRLSTASGEGSVIPPYFEMLDKMEFIEGKDFIYTQNYQKSAFVMAQNSSSKKRTAPRAAAVRKSRVRLRCCMRSW